jgi:enoyl-CoA hydratase/carnithine racemase
VNCSRGVAKSGGRRALSAVADVNELRDRDPASILAYHRDTGDVYEQVARLPQPTIAANRRPLPERGPGLALACDFCVGDATASFGFPEVGIGILPSSGGTRRLARLWAPAAPRNSVLPCERCGRDEAQVLGLLTEAVAEGRRSSTRSGWPTGAPRCHRSR